MDIPHIYVCVCVCVRNIFSTMINYLDDNKYIIHLITIW